MGTVVLAVLLSGLAAVATLALVLVTASVAVRWWSQRRGGLAAEGVVVPVLTDPDRTESGEHRVVAEFRTRDGASHQVTVASPWPLEPGTTVTLRYPAGRPEGAVLEAAGR